jgi:hypothetical protein
VGSGLQAARTRIAPEIAHMSSNSRKHALSNVPRVS